MVNQLKTRIGFKEVILVITIILFLTSIFIKNSLYLNIAVIISCCLVFFILNILEPIQRMLSMKESKFSSLISITINICIIVMLIIYLVFPNPKIFIALVLLFISNIVFDIMVKKDRDYSNYVLFFIMLLYLFQYLLNR